MAFHDDLLQQSIHLLNKERKAPKQASMRRAVSTAYYALFHLLISEAVSNWGRANLRSALGRVFDHGTMKAASRRLQNPKAFPFAGEDQQVVSDLRQVAGIFADLQEQRHIADYDNTTVWARTDADEFVKSAEIAFEKWKRVRNHEIAQAYLVSLIVKKRD